MINKKAIILILVVVAVVAYAARKDLDALKNDIPALIKQKALLSAKTEKLSHKGEPKASSFDDTRFNLKSLGIKPQWNAPFFTYVVAAASLETAVAKIIYLKNLLPYTYIERVSLDKNQIKIEFKTRAK